MSAIPGSFRSLVDNSASFSQGTQRQHIGAKILWILMMILAPFLSPVYLLVSVCWVCLIGRLSAETKVTIFVMMVFFAISWIPMASIIVYLRNVDSKDSAEIAQIKMVNGLTPIVAYYVFTIWGIVVAFRRFKLADAYEIETNRRDVACLRDIIIEPRPIPIPGAREMMKHMKQAQEAKRNAFGQQKNGGSSTSAAYPLEPVPWYKRIFGKFGGQGGGVNGNYASFTSSSFETYEDSTSSHILGDSGGGYGGKRAGQQHNKNGVYVESSVSQQQGFVLPSDDDDIDENAVTINTVVEITNALELYVHLKGRPKYVKIAVFSAFTLAAATVTIVRTLASKQNSTDSLWVLSTIFFCGMFLVFYSVFAFIIIMYLNQVRFIQRLTSSIVGDRNSGIAWVRAHNLSHLRAWEAVRRLAVLEITNPDSVLNSLFTPSMFLSSLSCLIIAAYIILRLLFEMVEVGPFIMTLLVLFVLLLGFMILVTGVANYAQSHLKLHTSIIAQKTYEIAKLIDEKYGDIERGLLVDTDGDGGGFTDGSFVSESDFTQSIASFTGGKGGRARKGTVVQNWEDQFDDEDELDPDNLRNTLMRNSSLADPENARAQLEALIRERKFTQRQPRRQPPQASNNNNNMNANNVSGNNNREVDENAMMANPQQSNGKSSGIQLPQYFQPKQGAVPVGFGYTDQKLVQTVVKSATNVANAADGTKAAVLFGTTGGGGGGYSSRSHSDLETRRSDNHHRPSHLQNGGDGSGYNSATYHSHGYRERHDTEALEKLSITALESCHASLLSLCNYFVANQPRPLILGMQLQNVRYAIVFLLLISVNLMFLALMLAFKGGKCRT